MTVTISQYIEAVQNPNGRFRTLKDLFALPDDSGEPRMQTGDICADFDVMFQNGHHILKCLLGVNAKHRERLKEIALFTQLIDTPYLIPYTYLEDEITVFDTAGKAQSCDALLRKKPEGARLCDFLTDAAAANDSTTIWKFGSQLPELAKWMWDNEFSAGSISSHSIYIGKKGSPVLTDYTHALRKRSLTDIRAICALEAVLYCCACEPRLFKTFFEKHLTGRSKLIGLAGELNELLADEGTSTLTGLLAMLSAESANYDEYVAYLFELSGKLASEEPLRIGSLSSLADTLTDSHDAKHDGSMKTTDGKLSKYTYLGELSCNLMRAFDGRKWCYVDTTGKAVICGGFLDASDFEEGRAVVETDKGFGIIDTDGKFIVDAVYDDLDWDSYNNIAIATRDGKSGLFSRMGERLTGLSYDHILNCNDGLIPARKGKLFGYLRKDGSVAIDFMFEDAFGFRDGVARVRHSGHDILIDTEGNEIDRIIR